MVATWAAPIVIAGVRNHPQVGPIIVKDACRDAWLRSDGWLVFRVDDQYGIESMLDQVARVCQVVHSLR
jgi:very-short-patch-repair endonuclease